MRVSSWEPPLLLNLPGLIAFFPFKPIAVPGPGLIAAIRIQECKPALSISQIFVGPKVKPLAKRMSIKSSRSTLPEIGVLFRPVWLEVWFHRFRLVSFHVAIDLSKRSLWSDSHAPADASLR